MKQSTSYYLCLLAIKLKGIKRSFSRVPIDFKRIRKEDLHEPRGRFFKNHLLRQFKILDSQISEIGLDKSFESLVIFIHGGAFISGPAKHHWEAIKVIAKGAKHKIWMCDYPKAPEHQIDRISENIDAIYTAALQHFEANRIILIGDSVGGTLATALVQRSISRSVELPAKLILISPVMDASLSNPEIAGLDKLDPMLNRAGVLSAKRMCAGERDLKNPDISPLYGDFTGFPRTVLFIAQNDIMSPDARIAARCLKNKGVEIEVIEGNNMPHIWPLLPLMKEAKSSLNQIVAQLNEAS